MRWPNIWLSLLLVMLAGCTTNSDPFSDYPDEIKRFAVISLPAPGFSLLPTDSFALHPNLASSSLGQDGSMPGDRRLLEDSIEQSFRARGLNFYPYVSARSDFWVVYVIVLDDSSGDDQILRTYGMMPGFVTDTTTSYEKGTLIVDLVDSASQRQVWRGSVQGLVAPDLPEEVRRLRLQSAIDQMLSNLPIAAN